MEKKWKFWALSDCPNCGSSIEVFSAAPEEQDTEKGSFAYDGDDCRCTANCGFKSVIHVGDEYAGMDEDGNLDELEELD